MDSISHQRIQEILDGTAPSFRYSVTDPEHLKQKLLEEFGTKNFAKLKFEVTDSSGTSESGMPDVNQSVIVTLKE